MLKDINPYAVCACTGVLMLLSFCTGMVWLVVLTGSAFALSAVFAFRKRKTE